MNLYGFASGDPVNFSDPLGLCPNPSGFLQCFFEDAIGGAKQAFRGSAQAVDSHVRVGASGTMGNYTVSAKTRFSGRGEAGHGIMINSPNIAASGDISIGGAGPDGALTGSIDFGLGRHLGLSADVYYDPNTQTGGMTGVTLHIGTPEVIPASPVGLTIDLPTRKPKSP
jgi:hypothetical protein